MNSKIVTTRRIGRRSFATEAWAWLAAAACTWAGLITTSAAEAKAAAPALRMAAERTNAVYAVGEEVRFHVVLEGVSNAAPGSVVSYVLDDWGPNVIGKGEAPVKKGAAWITGKMTEPGFIRCQVTLNIPGGAPLKGIAGAGISPEQIQASLPPPADFDDFWKSQKARLAAIPPNPKLQPVESGAQGIQAFDVQVACAGGAPVSGYFARPDKAAPKSLPAILFVHGAGVRSSGLKQAVTGAKLNMLSMDINAHGITNGQPEAFYKELEQGALKDYRYAGRDNRDTCYFLGMYLRLVRAIDFLTAQPEWDGKVVAVTGHSQGGGQSLVAGGLDQRVTVIAAGVPAMCDHTGMSAHRVSGWPKLVPVGADGKADSKVLETARYFDAVNFARRCRADAMLSVGFVDGVCPPTSCYAAFNQLKGRKDMIPRPAMSHAAPPEIQADFIAFIQRHVANRTGKK